MSYLDHTVAWAVNQSVKSNLFWKFLFTWMKLYILYGFFFLLQNHVLYHFILANWWTVKNLFQLENGTIHWHFHFTFPHTNMLYWLNWIQPSIHLWQHSYSFFPVWLRKKFMLEWWAFDTFVRGKCSFTRTSIVNSWSQIDCNWMEIEWKI